MVRRPGDDSPEPPGGRAAERLRDLIDGRFPEGDEPSETPTPADDPDEPAPNDPSSTGEHEMNDQ